MIRALPCDPEGYYTALRPLTGAAKYARGAHEHVDAKIESGVRLRVVHAKVRPMHPGPRVIFGYFIYYLVSRTERERAELQ
jgi:hypothetical protein